MNKSSQQIDFNNTKTAYAHLSNSKLKNALRVYQLIGNNFVSKIGSQLTKIAVFLHLPIKPFVKKLVFDHFCGGETLKECMPVINLMEQRKVGINLNYGVEIKKNESDFEKTFAKIKGAIGCSSKKRNIKVISCKVSGLGSFDILEKKQAKLTLTEKEEKAFEKMLKRMHEICELAEENEVLIYWDAEESWVQDVIDDIIDTLLLKYNQHKAIIFNTYQLYRHDKLDSLIKDIEKAKQGGYFLGAKLVRGAYIEKENEWAEEHNLPSAIHTAKAYVDADFNKAIEICLDNISQVSVCIATHNEESNLIATQLMEQKGIHPANPHVTFSQLYGMGDFITFNLANNEFNTTKYLPYGPVREVVPYLIRRAEENTSVDGQTGRELTMLKNEIKRRGI